METKCQVKSPSFIFFIRRVYQDKIYVPCPDDICVVAKFWLVMFVIWM